MTNERDNEVEIMGLTGGGLLLHVVGQELYRIDRQKVPKLADASDSDVRRVVERGGCLVWPTLDFELPLDGPDVRIWYPRL